MIIENDKQKIHTTTVFSPFGVGGKLGNGQKTDFIYKKIKIEKNFIEEFNSIADAARSIEGFTQKTKHNKIGECCNNKRISAYNFLWKF